jgi:hypothetical protein
MKKILKNIFFKNGNETRSILFGIGMNIKMKIDIDSKLQRLLGLDEREIQTVFRSYAKQSRCFIDVGSSDGYYGLLFRKYNKTGRIFLIDANERFKNVQKENFSLNNYDLVNVEFISKYTGSESNQTTVRLIDIVDAKKTDILFLKIDVDGAEMDVLKGSKSIFDEFDCKIIIETHSKLLEEQCIDFLKSLGYEVEIIDNGWYRSIIPELRTIEHNRWLSAEKRGKA